MARCNRVSVLPCLMGDRRLPVKRILENICIFTVGIFLSLCMTVIDRIEGVAD